MKTRTRFAPSPTGYMHVGNLRTALYAFLKARADGGTFILRIEDTDRERLKDGALDIIYSTLKETGLVWDEGPDIGGPYAPYVQSERMGMYMGYAQKLVEKGKAYYCFCTKEHLETQREIQTASGQVPRYDGHCKSLSAEQVAQKLAATTPFVIRQMMPKDEKASFEDVVYGHIEVDSDLLDDQILIKTDGYPTYNFCNVIDDHIMNISHVIRGSEYLSSAPKYNLLYESFGWEVPQYIHCPPVMKDATHKLSKRFGDASYEDLVKDGFLTTAILNYIALLGWSPKGEKEIFSLQELIEAFDVSGISKSPAMFDIVKLRHINAEHIRALSKEEFYQKAKPYIDEVVKTDCDTELLTEVLQNRCDKLNEIPEQIDFIDLLPEYELSLFEHKKMKTNKENSLEVLQELLPVLEKIDEFTKDNIHEAAFALIERKGVKNGIVLWPLRTAVSGKQFTPGGGIELAAIIGKEKTLQRVEFAINQLLKG